jgi:3-oxoadipate enol-lactonase
LPEVLNHVVHGPRARGPALLLVHPLGASLEFWDECIAAWKPHIACVACDLRPVSIAQHVADLEALRSSLGLHRVIPVGCAVGAMTAAAYAARFQEQEFSAALVMANPAPCIPAQAGAMLRERAASVRRGGMAAILPAAVDNAFKNQPRDERYARYLERFAQQDAMAYAESVESVADADVTADLQAIRCPTLIVAGAHDALFPPEQARRIHESMHKSVPGTEFVLMPDAAHFAPLQQPEAFARLVLGFLTNKGGIL